MSTLHLNLLGKPEIYRDGTRLTGFSTAKTEALLYYLAVTGRAHRRETLATLFWGEMDESTARRNLTKALSALRAQLGDYLLAEPQSIALHFDASVSLDIQAFEKHMAAQDAATLRAGAALYRGDFLEGFSVKDTVEFEEWMIVQREHLRERMMEGMERLVNQFVAQGNTLDGATFARRLLELDPWRESAHRKLMGLLARQGQYAAALAQYEKCRQTLLDELGVEPMPETRQLFERIQAARRLVPPSLPADREPFIGRKAELARLHEMLSDPTHRLITLVGLGGMGKTRLALAAARTINQEGALRFLNGVVFIPLAEVTDPYLPPALIEALGISLTEQTHPARAVINFLKNKETLLVLDNFEQLLDGAHFLTEILNACPHVKLLVTSREPLQLAAEWRVDLDGLAYPPTDDPAPDTAPDSYDAFHLFLQAARQVRAGYELSETDLLPLQQLCQLVGGMPLALKLAAGWVRVMPVADILQEVERCLDVLSAQLRDLPPRQRSIRAVIDSTWRQLTAEEQQVFQALAVFRGGFTREAAGQVAGAKLMAFAKLLEKSLIQSAENDRFRMHALLRQFADEKLAENNADEIHTRYSAFYLAFLRARADQLVGQAQQVALAEIGDEIENIRAAWRWAAQQGNMPVLAQVIGAFYDFHQIRSHFQEGEEIFGWTVAQFQAAHVPPELTEGLARLYARLGAFHLACSHTEKAQPCLQTALTLTDDPAERVFILALLGRAAIIEGDRAKGEEFLNESLQLSRAQEDVCGMAEALRGLAHAAVEFGEFQQAREHARQSLALSRELARPDWIALTLGHLAWAETCLGDYSEAELHWREGLEISRQLGDPFGEAINLNFLGWVGWCMGGEKVAEAISLIEQAITVYRAGGYREKLVMGLGDYTLALLDGGEHVQAWRAAREAVALGREIESVHYLVYALYVFGAAALANGDLSTSRASLVEALRLTWEMQKADNFMSALYFYAQLLIKEGELDAAVKAEKQTQALECLTVIIAHPSTWRVIRERAERLMAAFRIKWPENNVEPIVDMLHWYEWATKVIQPQD